MTKADARKLNQLLKTYKVIYTLYNKVYTVHPHEDINSVYILSNVGGCTQLSLETVPPEDFHVNIPLTEVKRGLQP